MQYKGRNNALAFFWWQIRGRKKRKQSFISTNSGVIFTPQAPGFRAQGNVKLGSVCVWRWTGIIKFHSQWIVLRGFDPVRSRFPFALPASQKKKKKLPLVFPLPHTSLCILSSYYWLFFFLHIFQFPVFLECSRKSRAWGADFIMCKQTIGEC